MRLKIFPWLGQQFVSLSWEGSGAGSVEDEIRQLLALYAGRLQTLGLSLDNTVRTRLWCRDMATWEAGALERARVLSGQARSTSSSHIRPERLGASARVGIDLLAMFPPAGGERKQLREYEPHLLTQPNQWVVLRSLTWGGLVFLSGQTDMSTPTLDGQFPIIFEKLGDSLKDAGVAWENVERASFFLHRDETVDRMRGLFRRATGAAIPSTDYTFVDYRQGKRVEIELTARLGGVAS